MRRIIKQLITAILVILILCSSVLEVYASEMSHSKNIDVVVKKNIDGYENVYSTTVSMWRNGSVQAGEFKFKFTSRSMFIATSLKVHHITDSTAGYDWFVNCMSSFGGKVAPFDIYCVNNNVRTEFSKSLKVDISLPDNYTELVLYFLDSDENIASIPLTRNENGYSFTVSKGGYYVFVDSADLSGEQDPVTRYTVTASAGKGGHITPDGVQVVSLGEDMEFIIVADDGYKITDVKVDGISVGSVESYTLTDIRENHTIEAVFERTEVNIGTILEDFFDLIFGGFLKP